MTLPAPASKQPDRRCQCVKTCGVCIPCPNEMDAEDLLCPECRADPHTGRSGCICHNIMQDDLHAYVP